MKPPVPGEIVLTTWRARDGEIVTRKALFVQHCDYPEKEWLARELAADDWMTAYQGCPKGWWYVMDGDRPTYWMPPHGSDGLYVYDGSRWRKQRYEHFMEWGPDPSKPDGYVNRFDLVEEMYLPQGEDPKP